MEEPPQMICQQVSHCLAEAVADAGLTTFRHMPHLPGAEKAKALLKRIAEEFLLIIRNRGYDILSVTE